MINVGGGVSFNISGSRIFLGFLKVPIEYYRYSQELELFYIFDQFFATHHCSVKLHRHFYSRLISIMIHDFNYHSTEFIDRINFFLHIKMVLKLLTRKEIQSSE